MPNSAHQGKTLILGIGNDILMDDGIGPKLVNQLKLSSLKDCYTFETACLGGLEILEFISGYTEVIIIDAIKTKNGIPGDVYWFTPEDFKETLHLSNFHDVSFLTALELGKYLGFLIPVKIRILAVEIVEDAIFGNEFSAQVQAKYEDIYNEILSYLMEQVKAYKVSK